MNGKNTDMVFWPRHDHRLDRALGLLMGAAIGDALLRWSAGDGTPEPAGVGKDTQGARTASRRQDTNDLGQATGRRNEAPGMSGPMWTAAAVDDVVPGRGALDVGAAGRAVVDGARWVARTRGEPTWRDGGGVSPLLAAVPAVVLAMVGRPGRTAAVARAMAVDADVPAVEAEACVLWAATLAGAVEFGGPAGARTGLRHGMATLPAERRRPWRRWLARAERPGSGPPPGPAADVPDEAAAGAVTRAWTTWCQTPVPPLRPADGEFPCLHAATALLAAVAPPQAPAGRVVRSGTARPSPGVMQRIGDIGSKADPRQGRGTEQIDGSDGAGDASPVDDPDPAVSAARSRDRGRSTHAGRNDGAVRAGVRGQADVPRLVGVVAGALAGACWGLSGLPVQWQRRVRVGGARAHGLIAAAALALSRGRVDGDGWPLAPSMTHAVRRAGPPWAVPLPADGEVLLGNLAAVRGAPGLGAVVSLCRVGVEDTPDGVDDDGRALVWMVDTPGANPNLHFVIDQAARSIAAFRAEGKRVLVHCAFGRSRTPAVAARYAALRRGVGASDALITTLAAVQGHLKNPELAHATAALGGGML